MAASPSGQLRSSFLRKLEGKFDAQPSTSPAPHVVLVNAEGPVDTLKQVQWVLQGFDDLERQKWAEHRRLIVILPMYVAPERYDTVFGRWSLRRLRSRLASLDPARLTLLPRLGAIESHHLVHYRDRLPDPIREELDARFDTERMGAHLADCLEQKQPKRYAHVYSDVAGALERLRLGASEHRHR